jgi:AmmeMemoRadiSam system protein B/AmmeMemoRadiSam system protein A
MRKFNIKFYFSCALVLVISLLSCGKSHEVHSTPPAPDIIHNAHLSGGWYSLQKDKLEQDLDLYFSCAKESLAPWSGKTKRDIRALIVPHAGHYYSGLCAASAYQALAQDSSYSRVIILCPSHTAFIRGIAVPDFTIYRTVLGDISIDNSSIETLKKNSKIFSVNSDAHNTEHAIEIQLPFLQKRLNKFSLVPLIVGHLVQNDYKEIVEALKKIIDPSTLVIISTDFIHYGPQYEYEIFAKDISANIRFVDSLVAHAVYNRSIEEFDKIIQDTGATVCGQNPLRILLFLLATGVLGNIDSRLTCYYQSSCVKDLCKNSGALNVSAIFNNIPDSQAGQSVSYMGVVFTTKDKWAKEDLLSQFEKRMVVNLARATVENSFKTKSTQVEDHLLPFVLSENLERNTGAFVTLNKKNGELRGCIGSIEPVMPLFQTVIQMARSAAFNDTRFAPLKRDELDNIVFDVTVLTPPVKVNSYKDIIIGTHGVVLNKLNERGVRVTSSVFLPQVPPAFGWNLETTLEQLSLKAGLLPDAWKSSCEFEVFEGFEIQEH